MILTLRELFGNCWSNEFDPARLYCEGSHMFDQLRKIRQESLLQRFAVVLDIFDHIGKLVFKPDTGGNSVECIGDGIDLGVGAEPVVLDHAPSGAAHTSIWHQCLPLQHTRIKCLDHFIYRSRIERRPVIHQQMVEVNIEGNAGKTAALRAKTFF